MDRFTWTYRQFVGGNAALDLANTVIYPDDPTRRFDRIVDAIELGRWVAAGVRLAALPAAVERRFGEAERGDALRLRDAIDAVFRPIAGGGSLAGSTFADLLRSAAAAIAGAPSMQADHAIALKTPSPAAGALSRACRDQRPRARLFAGGRPGESLSRLRLALHRPQPEPAAHLVRHGSLRQPGEIAKALCAARAGKSEGGVMTKWARAGLAPGCPRDGRLLERVGPYIELRGGGFLFNYRIAEATAGLVVVPLRTLPEGSTIETSFENPAGGPPIVLSEKVSPKQTKFDFTTPPLTGIKADKDYAVTVRLVDADGKELQRIDKMFHSQLDQSVLPPKPLTIGPGYTPNPQLDPDGTPAQ